MRQKCRTVLFAFVILFIFLSKVVAGGGVMWQENGVLVCDSTFGGGLYPMGITSDGNKGAIIVWEDGRTLSGIACQRIDSLGNTMWDSDGVFIDSTADILPYPSIVSDGSGGAIISWVHDEMPIGKVYVQRVRYDGIPLWGYPGIPVAISDSTQSYPSIVSDGAGGCIVVWLDRRNNNYDIYAQRVDSSGNLIWNNSGIVVCITAGPQYRPQITSDGFKGAVITWEDSRSGNYQVFAQHISNMGVQLWEFNGLSICTLLSVQPSIVNVNNNFIISWNDFRNGNKDVYAQRISLDGSPQWTENGIPICVADSSQGGTSIIADNCCGAIISWWDYRNGNWDIYSQRVDSSGTLLWDSVGVAVCDADSDQEYLSVVSDGRSGAIVSWQDYRNGNWDIYCQRIDSSGVLQWGVGGLPVCITPEEQGCGPVICEDGENGGIIAWGDKRYHASVFAQRVGDVEGVEERKDHRHKTEDIRLFTQPNPFTKETVIRYSLIVNSKNSRLTPYALRIYDVSGRLVKTFSLSQPGDCSYKSGTTVTWDGRDKNGTEVESGIYFVKYKNVKTSLSLKVIKINSEK